MSTVATIVERAGQVRDLLDAVLTEVAEATVDAPDAADDRLRSLLVGLERTKNSAEALQADVMVELGREALAEDDAERAGADAPVRSHEEYVPDEIAALLSCTRMAAATRYDLAWQVARHQALAAGWRTGLIDARKVGVIADQLRHVSAEVADGLAGPAVKHATGSTAPQTREWLRRKVLAVDPAAAEKRREAALLDRKVVITPVADGMSDLWARLPSVEARQMQVGLSRMAQELGADDPRTMDQRRADALVDLVLGRATPVKVSLQLVAPVGAVDGASGGSGQPAWIPGLGPVTSQAARELLERAGGQPGQHPEALLMVDAASGRLLDRVEPTYRPSRALDLTVRSRDLTCRFPGCRRSALGRASGTDLDHTVPWPAGPTSDDNLAVLCRHHHRLKHSAGWQVTLSADGSMTWTTPTGRIVATEAWQYVDPTDRIDRAPGTDDPDPPPD